MVTLFDGSREMLYEEIRVEKYIKKVGSEYGVYSSTGKLIAKHKTRADALKQLGAIEAAKAKKKG